MIIVTGGAGFIGSNLVRGLNRRGKTEVLVVDDLENGDKHRNLNALRFTDFVDRREFGRCFERMAHSKVEAVFHQGACSDTMETDGRYVMDVNYDFSKRLLELCLDRGIPLLYASSAAVYGDGRDGFREEPTCEYPLNVYAFSKFLLDRWVRRELEEADSQIVGLRYFNVYGPQERHKGRMASVVQHFHDQVASGGKMRVFEGSDGFRRDFVFVDDVVDVNLHFLDHPEQSGIFNCGSGRAESFGDLARAVRDQYEGAEIEEIPFPPELVGKYQAYTQADLSALRAAGYDRPFTSIADGVASYTALLKETGGYYRSVA